MQISVHSIQFKADVKLIDFIKSKLEKLEHFHDKLISAEVFLRLEKNHEEGNKITEIKLNIPGKELFAKRQSQTFEEATDKVVEALRRQVRKAKGKQSIAA